MNNFLSKIPQEWIDTAGLGINVGFCETGFNLSSIEINQQIIEYKSFGKVAYNHGNHVVSIVCDKDAKMNNIGLANKANIFIGATSLLNEDSKENFCFVLEWLKQKKLDVLNLSLAFDEDNKTVKNLLEEISKETLIVCSYSAKHSFPNSYPFIISVGYNNYDNSDIVAPRTVVSLGTGDIYSNFSGTSASCAVVSMVCCLAKAYDKEITKEEIFKKILGETLLDFSEKKPFLKRRTQRIVE